MITLKISWMIKGKLRKDLWDVCCSSFPHIVMSDSDIDSDTWVVEQGDTTEENYLKEQSILRECIANCKCAVLLRSDNVWFIKKELR